ncbi:MAG: hypothetical protein ACXWH0_00180 [Acidimicrobiia bacterium]
MMGRAEGLTTRRARRPAMHETTEDLENLQLLLNRSFDQEGPHLRAVVPATTVHGRASILDLEDPVHARVSGFLRRQGVGPMGSTCGVRPDRAGQVICVELRGGAETLAAGHARRSNQQSVHRPIIRPDAESAHA